MNMNSEKIVSNLIWRVMERWGAQLVTFVVSIVLARLLDPVVYGKVALVIVFTSLFLVLVDGGFGAALIQKKDADELDFSTVFYFNIFFCGVIYVFMFFAAPLIARYYNDESLVSIVRVMSLVLLIYGVKNTQHAYISKNLMFKKFFFATLTGTIVAAISGIALAYLGFGVWALVFQNLINTFIDTVFLWFSVKWRPKLIFSFARLKSLFSYGVHLVLSALLDTGYHEIRSLIIGKLYTSSDLAFYSKGEAFPKLIVSNINKAIDSVLLPVLSSEQDRIDRVKAMTRRSISISSYVLFPMLIGLAVCAEPIIRLLLTEKWLSSVFYMRMFCITYAFYPLISTNGEAIKAIGRSDLFFKLEVLKKICGIIALLATMFISVKAMALSLLITCFTSQIINSWPNKKLLNYSYFEQVKDIAPSILLSLFMGVIVFLMGKLPINYVILLLLQVITGAMIYVSGSLILRIESFFYLKTMIKAFMEKRRKKRDK